MPDVASAHENVTVTSELFHPAAFALGDWLWLIVGGVPSIFTEMAFADSVLPALSTLQYVSGWMPSPAIWTEVPVCGGEPSSVYFVAATAERLSEAVRLTVTLVLFQSVAGAVAAVIGAVLSILTAGLLVAVVVLPALSETDAGKVRPFPSELIVLSAGHEPAMPESPSEHVQRIVTFAVYQPFVPFGEVVGAPKSVGATLSILIEPTVVLLLLSALSTVVPVAD